MRLRPPPTTLFPYTTLFRSNATRNPPAGRWTVLHVDVGQRLLAQQPLALGWRLLGWVDRKSTRLNSSHTVISYAVFCLKKKKNTSQTSEPHAHTLASRSTRS